MEKVLKDWVDFELKMIENAKIENLVSVKSVDKVGEKVLYYGDDYKRLFEDDSSITRELCVKIFATLKSLYENLGDYFLSFNKLSLDTSDIFLDKDESVSFMYLPEKTVDSNFEEKLERLLSFLIDKMGNEEDLLKVKQNLSINTEKEDKNVDYLLEIVNSKF